MEVYAFTWLGRRIWYIPDAEDVLATINAKHILPSSYADVVSKLISAGF